MDNPIFEVLFEEGFGSWREGSVFAAAVSGGADSTAMLSALAALAKKRNYKVHCLHVMHNIRSAEESEQDVRFVRALCRRLEIPCRVVTIKPGKITQRSLEKGIGIEAAAREYRQAAYKHEVKRLGAEKIVVAHNKDDVLENSIMRIFRGAGPRGLASMPSSAKMILRPMLHISRKQILLYLEKMHQPYQTDLSNNDNQYLRNRVRNVLIPVLNEHFPDWKKGIESLGETQFLIAEYAEAEARKSAEWHLCVNGVETCSEHFNALSPVIQEEAVFQGIEKLLNHSSEKHGVQQADVPRQYKVPRRRALRQFLMSDAQSMDLGKIRLQRSGGIFQILFWEDPLLVRGGTFCAEKPGSYQFMGYSIQIDERRNSDAGFYCEFPVVFRSPFMGEKIPSGKVQKKKTKDIKNSIIVEDRNGKIALLSFDGNILLYDDRKSIGNNAVSVTLKYLGGFDERKQ